MNNTKRYVSVNINWRNIEYTPRLYTLKILKGKTVPNESDWLGLLGGLFYIDNNKYT